MTVLTSIPNVLQEAINEENNNGNEISPSIIHNYVKGRLGLYTSLKRTMFNLRTLTQINHQVRPRCKLETVTTGVLLVREIPSL